MATRWIFVLLLCVANLHAEAPDGYLLPPSHPAWEVVETLGLNPSCAHEPAALQKLGFVDAHAEGQPRGRASVWRHPHLEGYLLKIVLAKAQKKFRIKPLKNYLMRIENARKVRAFLDEHEYTWLTVPEKWLYQVGDDDYLMVVEEMHLVPGLGNQRDCYRNMEEECLIQLIDTLLHFPWGDDRIENLPFTTDGQITFIDTECIRESLLFKTRIVRYLRPEIKSLALQLLSK